MTAPTRLWPRAILHIDMNAFFPSVEQRDFPELRDFSPDVEVFSVNEAFTDVTHCWRYGEFTVAPATLLGRSPMPKIIAPAWRSDGHRQHIPE